MSNIIDFTLRLKDMATAPLLQFGAVANVIIIRANALVKDLNRNIDILSASYSQLNLRIREVESTIRNSTIASEIAAARHELEGLQAQSIAYQNNLRYMAATSAGNEAIGAGGKSSGAGGSTLFENMGTWAGVTPNPMIGAAIGAGITVLQEVGKFIIEGIGKSFDRQEMQMSLNILAGSDEKGGALTKQLGNLQKETILGPEVFNSAETMMQSGFDSTEVVGNLKMLGDVSMGNANKLRNLTNAFSQVRAAGKLMEQDLLSFKMANFDPLQEIARATGKSMEEIKQQMDDGNISFAMLQDAFRSATSEGGQFNDMLDKMAKTPVGKKAEFSSSWDELKTTTGDTFMPVVQPLLDLANSVLPIISEWIKGLSSETGGWGDYINIMVDQFKSNFLPIISKIWHFFSEITTFLAHSELFKDIFSLILRVVSSVGFIMRSIINGVLFLKTLLFDHILLPLLEGIEKFYLFIKTKVIDAIKPLIDAALKPLRWLGILSEESDVESDKADGADKDAKDETNPDKKAKTKSTEEKKEAETANSLLGSIAGNTADNKASAASMESKVANGGPKVVNIYPAKFLDSINITTENMTQTVTDIEQMMLEMFARIVVQGGAA